MIKSFSAELNKLNAYDLAQTIAKSSGILKDLYAEKDKGPEEVERYQNVEELLAGIKEFTISKAEDEDAGLAEFMIDVALLTDADESDADDKNYVSLMTIHSSKGLEFRHVFLVGMEENLFPSQLSINSRTELEEERRLFYVAVTRAMESCTLSYATSRFIWGNLVSSEPSRFIDEIDSKHLYFDAPPRGMGRSLMGKSNAVNETFSGGLNNRFKSAPNLKPLEEMAAKRPQKENSDLIKVGSNVIHDRFGKGKVTKMEGSGADKKATIFFPHHGAKTVLLSFANLTILDDE
jgi:DNA helicase-2/ATP-dependent DNA helicase PcrA